MHINRGKHLGHSNRVSNGNWLSIRRRIENKSKMLAHKKPTESCIEIISHPLGILAGGTASANTAFERDNGGYSAGDSDPRLQFPNVGRKQLASPSKYVILYVTGKKKRVPISHVGRILTLCIDGQFEGCSVTQIYCAFG